MPLKCDQKPPALTADALQLGSGLDLKSDLQGDFSKVVNQLMQSMIPNPAPPLTLNPQMHLQLLQQLLQLPVPMVPSASLLQNNMRLPSSSAVDSSLIGQIQMLTQQLLNQTAPAPANQSIGLNAGFDVHFKQPVEAPAVEMEHFDDNYSEDVGEMSSLDKRIMYMCQGGEAKDETDISHLRSLGDNDRSRKHNHSKKSTQAEFEERNTSEAGYGSDVANPSGSPNTPGRSSSPRSSPRRSSNYDDVGYGRTPSSCTNANNEEDEDELHNGSGMENDSESRCSDGVVCATSRRRSGSSRRSRRSGESRSQKTKRREDEVVEESRRSRKAKHESRSNERSSKRNDSPVPSTHDGRSDRSKRKKRSKHDSQNTEQVERRASRDDSRATEALKDKEASRKKHSSRTASSPERKKRKSEFTVEYGINEDDDDDDDVIFVDIQKKSVDVSRFLEKKLPSLKSKRKRTSRLERLERSSSGGSSVEFISQDSNSLKPNKAKEFMPPSKPNTISVCSTTLWIGHLNKLISEEELRAEITEFGEVTINLVPPRGCAFITFSSRAEAYKALEHLKNVSVQGNLLKVAWAAGVGIKNSAYYEKYDIDLGVTYIQWSEITNLDLPLLLDGSFIDEDSLPPNFDRGTLTTKKSKKKKTQQQDADATEDASAINPSLIPLPQAVPPLTSLPPPPLPPISNASINVSNSSQGLNVSLVHPPHGINAGMHPLPSPTTCYMLPPGSVISSSVNSNISNNLLSSPMGLLKGMPHFDPSIPPPRLPPTMPPLPGSDTMSSNVVPYMPQTSLPTTDMMMRRIEISPHINRSSSEVQTNHSLSRNMDSISSIPVVNHSQHDGNINHQNSVLNSRTFMSSTILQGPLSNSNSSTIEKSQLPPSTNVLPISASSVLHPPPQMVMMEKPSQTVNMLPPQHNFLIRQPLENKLTMPGSVLGPFRTSSNSLEQPLGHLVAPVQGDVTDQQQESTNNGNPMLGQRPPRPRDTIVQQNLLFPPHVMSVNQMRPNLYQPPPSSSLTTSMNHQETVKRLPMPSEFLRRLGASTTSAPPQSNTPDNNASKQTPLLPMPQVNVPPPLLQVQSSSPMGGGTPQDGLVNIPPTSSLQNNEPQASLKLQDSKLPRKQPLLETPVTPKDNSFNSQLLHPSQMLNMNHPAYHSLDSQKKDPNSAGGGMPSSQTLNADRFKTPRPPRAGSQGEQFDGPENQQLNLPIILNFANPSSSSVTEALITEAIKSLTPLVRIPNPQECMGLLRSPLMNPASFLTGPHILGTQRLDMRMHLRSPGMRGPNNFKMGDRRNLLRPSGLNHQRSPLMRHRFPHNQQ